MGRSGSEGRAMRWGLLGGVASAHGAGVARLVGLVAGLALASCGLLLLTLCLIRAVRGRRERAVVRAWSGARTPNRRGGSSPLLQRARLLRHARTGKHRGRAEGQPSTRELALLVAEVSTRLRAGSPASSAWTAAMERIGVGCAGESDAAYPPVLDQWVRAPARWRSLAPGQRPPDAAAARLSAASVIAACRFSHGLGAPLADVLDAIGGAIDDAQAVEEARRVASAGPLMSARVLAGLPLVGVAAALALGASPWSFYTGGGAGSVCAAAGLIAWGSGIAACRRILARCRRADASAGRGNRRGRAGVGPPGSCADGQTCADAALACDLVASGLACGASIPRTLGALAEAFGHEPLAWTASALLLGASWEESWEESPPWAAPLRDALEVSWTCGTAPEGLLTRCASWERRARLIDAKAQAEELSVRLVGPLAAFFLPAFLLLGIAPLLAHLMGGIGG